MEAWRNTGYVPDSDEDDEFESQGTTNAHAKDEGLPTVHNAELQSRTSRGEENDAEDVKTVVDEAVESSQSIGLRDTQQKVEDVEDNASSSEDELQVTGALPKKPTSSYTSKPPTDQSGLVFDDDSSLSSLSPPPSKINSPEGTQQLPQIDDFHHTQSQRFVVRDEKKSPEEGSASQKSMDLLPPSDIPVEVLHDLIQPARRSLRQRQPIQLHPYLIEDAKYRGQFKNSGIKPIRIPTAEHVPADHQKESQEGSILDAPESPPSSPPSEFIYSPSSPPDPYRSPRSDRRHRTPKQISHSTLEQDQSQAHKRRKLFHASQAKVERQKRSSFQVVINQANSPSSNESIRPVDIPPSPPRSGSLPSGILRRDGFRFPPGFTPPPNTAISKSTPLLSADANDSALHDKMEIDVSNDEPIDELPTLDEDSDDEGIPNEENLKVKRLQRRIKGVLPASWLRLDLKNQGERATNSSSERRQVDSHAIHAEPTKGVARKVVRAQASTIQSPTIHRWDKILSDSSDSDSDAAVRKDAREVSVEFVGPSNLHNETVDDIPEDNRIDDMFPRVPRSFFGPKKSRLSRPKTSKANHDNHNNRSLVKNPLRLQTQNRNGVSHPKIRVSRPRAPKLGILDAPDMAQLPRKEQPQFLRIAARQVRSRRDQGRSSPNRKFFRMTTLEETEDTNKLLRDWKKGTMKQRKLPMVRSSNHVRQPLRNIQANTQAIGESEYLATYSKASANQARPERLKEISSTSETETLAQSASFSATQEQAVQKFAKRSRARNMKVISRSLAIHSLKRSTARPVESENVGSQETSSAAFSMPLAELNKAYRKRPITLDRFLSTRKHPSEKVPVHVPLADRDQSKINPSARPNQTRLKFSRKRPPTRIDMSDLDAVPHMASSESQQCISIASVDDTRCTYDLQGFRNYKVFSVDFGIVPVHVGTYFHSSTFIGEGVLSRSINLSMRNLDQDAGFAIIESDEQRYRWGPWNEQVSSEIGTVIDAIIRDTVASGSSDQLPLDPDPFHIFTSVIKYINDKLHFFDPVDRISFIERIELLVCKIRDHVSTFNHTRDTELKRCLKLASLNTILAGQIQQIASHELVNISRQELTLNLVKDISRQLLLIIFSHPGLQNIYQFYENNRRIEFREAGIRDGFPAVEAYVIAFQLLRSSHHFKDLLEETLFLSSGDKASTMSIQHLEDSWKAIFTTIPLNEIDEFGHTRPGLRFRAKQDNWSTIRSLVLMVLDAYSLDPERPAHYINYCRAVFQRCFLLMVAWGWRDCKAILHTLFSFYAKNMLYNLKTEETFSSPSFLDMLDSNPLIEIEAGDSCFHLFLKILGSGLRYLSQVHDKKAMKNIAWRFLPNHGRIYPKEKALDREDLNALRNHHDLLCTLYWAVPDGCRPRLQIIRNLVDPATSHLETCNLSIRSWRRLVHFKLSTNEEDLGLKPFAEWYEYFTSELVRQHLLAKTEVEEQAKGQIRFSTQVLESTISHNQRQIEAILSSTVAAMKSAIQSTRSLEQACLLLEGVPFAKLLGLFGPTNSRVNPIINQALQIVIDFVSKESPAVVAVVPAINEDSQEYGDWSAIEEVYDEISEAAAPSTAIQYLHDTVQPIVSELLSNCFGQEKSPEDSLLLKVTECWSCMAQSFVKNGLHHWNSYLNSFSKHSWTALRTTPQTKKFAPQFLASCIEKDKRFFVDCRLQILEIWSSCLVERTSMLKFQHRLTEVLLNEQEGLLLFKNLPFYRREDNRYHITLSEFTDRRVSLISSLLSNMREHLEELEGSGFSARLSDARDEYRELVMALMSSMKANYQELNQSGKVAQGQYVEFVHRIVSFMQEHSQAICPLDKYFTDPTCFPPPKRDPEYIVARLKGYGVRLPSRKAAKALVTFLQSVCEVAALDDKQDDLVDQLCACMDDTYDDTYESGDVNKPTLRFFLFQCVFPAYIEYSLNHAAAWILVVPIAKAVSRAAQKLLYDIDINDHDCITSTSSIFGVIIESIQKGFRRVFDYSYYVQESSALLVLHCFVQMMDSMLQVLDYINRNGFYDAHNMSMLKTLRGYTVSARRVLVGSSTIVDPHTDEPPPSETPVRHCDVPSLFTETRAFAARELQTCLATNWSKHEGRYYIRRGKEGKEVRSHIVKLREIVDPEEAKATFVDAANKFLSRLELFNDFDESDLQLRPFLTETITTYDVHEKDIDDFII
ncbi:hypothetical protein UA08_03164 [Talaromyces atroroseus]|uniref:Uncharacterized protein n=1 Tax=Talaromyces atroroseus TaxID=1441469 RepID=A0A225B421_TALAT|nr:hypothetical protein UA08_03164 [Talaromyces atroroseus]OKL61595.1 hypothetical protein UA08_03164 [Talaromyces atroroseus]